MAFQPILFSGFTTGGSSGGGGGGGVNSISNVGSTPNGQGGTIVGTVLTLQPANGTNPGLLTSGVQTIGGNKTFTGSISASNLSGTSSGTNTGDVTLGTADGLSLSGQVLSLALSSTSTTGSLSSTDWNTFNNKQSSGNYITTLTGDVTASGPGSAASTVAKIQGITISGTTGTSNVVFSASPTLTGTLNAGSGVFTSTLSSSNFTGSSSGSNTGDQTITLTGAVTGSGTGSFATTLTNSAVTGQVLTGFTSGPNSTVLSTDSILQGLQKLQGQISGATVGANQTLSNLTSPTSVNQSLLPAADLTQNLGSATDRWNALFTTTIGSGNQPLNMTSGNVAGAATGAIGLNSGNVTSGSFSSGSLTFQTGGSTGSTGGISISTGSPGSGSSSGSIGISTSTSTTANSGGLTIASGAQVTSGVSGTLSFATGQAGTGASSGAVTLSSGAVTGGAGNSGSFTISSGNATGSGNSGTITLQSGTSSGTRGNIVLAGLSINASTSKINNVVDPTSPQDAATKNYVDTVASGLNPIQAVTAATTGSNIPGTYVQVGGGIGDTFTITSTATFTLDGITPTVGQRVLFKDQTAGQQNGVYNLTTAANVGVLGAIFTRSSDYNTTADVNAGDIIPVISGTVNATTSWLQTATVTSVGSSGTPMVFVQWTANPANYLLKANNLSDVSNTTTSFNNISGLTTLGDLPYGGASGTRSRLAGNTTATKNFLVQTGTGSISAAPSWGTIVSGDIPTLNQNTTGSAGSISGTNVITNSNLSQMAAHTYKGNNTGATANSIDVTNTQLTADLNQFTTSLQGVVPGSGGGTTNFLRADGTWTTPSAANTPVSAAVTGSFTSSGAGTPLIYPTVKYDTNSAYNASTGIYTAPSTGPYIITAYFDMTGNVPLGVYVNGSLYSMLGVANGNGVGSGSATVFANSGQSIYIVSLGGSVSSNGGDNAVGFSLVH